MSDAVNIRPVARYSILSGEVRGSGGFFVRKGK